MLQAAQQAQHAAAAAEKAAQQAASRHEDEKKQLEEQLAKLKQVTVMQPLSHHSTLSHARASSVAMDQTVQPLWWGASPALFSLCLEGSRASTGHTILHCLPALQYSAT